ncbi:tRNA (adenosine(37)-N6)-dimethylallyltransferase MiaA [Deinococcus psychrotolerans]|uniref:tRNA dimethylallyltransferase n=1 Tax=Deinococcus psychrotolerans TaxID=2489213 RepID=A0A3G8YL54_9DEIO|nr:tRNA (adenosine(37)-N6)-dimethylallyltransferase MiaA [Deinococcus psychrotolerans]AZI41816.1 tRNA (adenosine(37)-N6)-dimethylallyltransferase MiaA [Deinococcus psychrotolerans]
MLLPILTAPTAAGKTALALKLAQAFRLEIVAADAFTVYRGLDIGTAKPSAAEQQQVPHHLIDVVDVQDSFDVAQWLSQAETAITDVLSRQNIPLIVGGTGFYLKALMRGLPLTPPSDPAARAQIEAELSERGLDALLAEIAALNPAEAARMERNPRRVVRALEIQRRTGKFPVEFGTTQPAHTYRVFAFTQPDLEQRIKTRVDAMLAAGWPEEAAWLASQIPPESSATVWQALGYRAALALARGELTQPQAAAQISLQSRQYAKRQLTWARTQLGAEIQTRPQVEADLRALLSCAQERPRTPKLTP